MKGIAIKSLAASLIIFMLSMHTNLLAQADMISYGLHKTLPQANNVNLAMLPDYKFSIELPEISGFHINTGQNFTNLELFTSTDEAGNINTSSILDKIRRNNRVSTNNTVNLFHLGVRGQTSYTAFSINSRVSARTSIPREFFQFAILGNGSDQLDNGLLDLDRLSTNAMAFTKIGLSHGREILAGKMTVGVRLKYLIGHAYADTKSVDATLQTYGNDEFRGDFIAMNINQFDIRTAGIAASVFDDDFQEEDISNSVLSSRGFGVDLGATYQFTYKIKFFAS